MFHVSQGSAGLEASICMFQSFHPDSLGGFQILLPAPAQMFQDSRESWHRCVIYYEVLSPLASALQVFGSMNVMEKGSIWRHGTLSNFCGCLFICLFVFLKKRARPSSVIATLILPTKSSRSKNTVTGTFPGMEDVQFL